jgi:hypothetical protein
LKQLLKIEPSWAEQESACYAKKCQEFERSRKAESQRYMMFAYGSPAFCPKGASGFVMVIEEWWAV